jgi:hypothetical protein
MRGRALPCNFLTYSSTTLGSESSSRNIEHQRAVAEIRTTIDSRPVVFDREFSYLTFFKYLASSGMQFVIRLNQGSKPPKFYYDPDKREELTLLVAPDSGPKVYRNIYYKGEIKVNLIGIWKTGMPKPLWVITNIAPQEALDIYLQRMKIEMKFRTLKSIFRIETIMNKSKFYLDQMIALLLITYAISVLIGEAIRDVRYAGITIDQLNLQTMPQVSDNSRWYLYSGVFVLLRQRRRLCHATLRKIISRVFAAFSVLIGEIPVRSFVRT